MKFHPRIRYALAAIASLVIVACGGGGAKTNPNLGGTLTLLPTAATFYAGIPETMTISGGKPPYALTSSDPSVLAVPAIVNGNTFEVVGNNPGVIDPGLPPGSLPIKTVNISARDSTGLTATSAIQVGQNFLTSYTISFPTTTCALASGSTTITPCAGGDTVLTLFAVLNGSIVGDEQFRFEVVTGTMGFVNPIGSNTVTPTYTTTSDHQGLVTAIVRVPAGTPTQIGVIRVVQVDTGASNTYAFLITGAVAGPLAAVPATFTFTGADATVCGGGSGDFFVTGGTPPYTATSSDPHVTVVADNATTGHFTVSVASSATPCITASIIVKDSGGASPVTVTVTTVAGAAGPTPVAMTVSPDTIVLGCGGVGSIAAVGGSGNYSASSTNPHIVVSPPSGHTISVTLVGPYAVGDVPAGQTVNVTDGTTIASVAVTTPTSCP